MEQLQTKLFEAATRNSITSLQQLLIDDPLILERALVNRFNETPLHVAAMLGHVNFAREIIRLQPKLVNELNSHLSSPLHLAAAKGHVGVVKALLSVDNQACLARDRNELLPLHLAAAKGHVEAMKLLLEARPEATMVRACGGESILHLCVKSYQLEALKLIVKSVRNVGVLINSRNNDGNTILHLAVAEKQVEAVKYLVSVGAVDVDAKNEDGLTAMDVLTGSRRDVRDPEIVYLLKHGDKPAKMKAKKNSWDGLLKQHAIWLDKEKQTLMVVASLIAAMTFQVGVNPPDGLWKNHHIPLNATDPIDPDVPDPSKYITADYSTKFYLWNTVAFISSLSIILLLTSGLPIRRRFFMWILMVIIWVAISAAAGSYICVIVYLREIEGGQAFEVADPQVYTLLVWIGLMFLLLVGHTIRLIVRGLKKLRNGVAKCTRSLC
ncbi:ankyrin repeat-containing protein BDA1-like [Salvia hispanica]|uniref:ankyrin repeat-containing protein BDA1-like n=1 Tax=Salvia hispanica TaxID=49212 RepID=UPI002009C3F0|nr:ankyrin repeat-containing protein BDA1-like [Salvia hispanica]